MRRAKLDAQLALLLRDILRSGLSHGHSNPSLFSPLSYGLVLSSGSVGSQRAIFYIIMDPESGFYQWKSVNKIKQLFCSQISYFQRVFGAKISGDLKDPAARFSHLSSSGKAVQSFTISL